MTDKYDPKTCTTAAELRKRGCNLPEYIPDNAWVPSNSIRQKGFTAADKMELEFTKAFRVPPSGVKA